MKVLKWLDENFEEKLMGLALWGIVVIMGIQVIMRYVFRSSLVWSEEVSRYLFIWMVFIGISYGIKNGSHMRIDMLEHFFPKLRKGLGILADLCFLTFAAYMIGPGITVIESLLITGQTSPAGEIPMYIVYTGLLAGFILVLFRIVQKYILKFLQKNQSKGD
ncbi:TRAP-type C4-dicarboxylate transport system permease small subunit [Sedimentibacter acidaminivorans]|uniref:TRAP-type C4-dicarboxylate transport system permease small subunit n=1 Tax=Sedimentibacter acidaminivorans TaxID=913099 RepID=A0ABS4GFG7_9FIRM|nr:TRAP-type C4-dicarboxylate transport system permease small subunit [Sedimentibacter acidaminivorans]